MPETRLLNKYEHQNVGSGFKEEGRRQGVSRFKITFNGTIKEKEKCTLLLAREAVDLDFIVEFSNSREAVRKFWEIVTKE